MNHPVLKTCDGTVLYGKFNLTGQYCTVVNLQGCHISSLHQLIIFHSLLMSYYLLKERCEITIYQ